MNEVITDYLFKCTTPAHHSCKASTELNVLYRIIADGGGGEADMH